MQNYLKIMVLGKSVLYAVNYYIREHHNEVLLYHYSTSTIYSRQIRINKIVKMKNSW